MDESQKCNSGECVCPGGLLMREGHCIDPNRNNKYCGADDAGNPNGEKCNLKMNNVCRGGACECPPGQLKNKANECIDPKSDARYCGAVADSGGYVIDGTYSCGADRDCVDGDCVCRAGYRINRNGQCVKNSDEQCGARGDATSADPLNKDYMGYACSSGMSCGVMELVTVRDGVSTVTPLNTCISDGYSSCALDLGFYQNGIYVCPDSNIFKRCEASGSVNCECIPGYESALCSNTVKDDCSYTTCPESFECRIIDDVAQCVCPDGFVKIKANSINVCKEQLSLLSEREYCGTNADNIVACKSSEICENGKCVRCAVSQMLCLDKCMERNDLDPETGELASLAERHVVGCNASELTCEKGFANCNGTVLDGCESDLTSVHSCGSCDNVCPSEVTCSDGKCCLNPGKEISRKATDKSLEQIYNVRCCDSTASKLCATVAMGGEALSVVVQCRAACKSHEHDITDGKL
ncbi:MAG: hypothetical protein IJM59_07695 [Proteobacteria bacterium]|nr:hypothetical protein [Pseudomonadota bacterium]